MKRIFLYRGVNLNIHNLGKALQPKCRAPFKYCAKYDEATYDTGWKYDECDSNAAIKHQLNQEGFPTSGISTTPHYERAEMYATNDINGTRYEKGYVYKIDREMLKNYDVKEYIVAEHTKTPSIPEDEEVILVVEDDRAFPLRAIVKIIEVDGMSSKKRN